MKRSVWKWLLGISTAVLVLLILFTIGMWVLVNIGGAILLALMGNQEISAMPMADFLSNFVGSPMFYIYVVDISALLAGIVGMIVTKKKNNRSDQNEMSQL